MRGDPSPAGAFAGAFLAFAAAARREVEATLDALLPPADEPPRRLHQAMRYSVFAGGKRVRPVLTLLAGEPLGGARRPLLAAGGAVELIHTYSLIHDDLPALDDDDLRRGKPTVHRQFDEATAILAGDALLTCGLTALAAIAEMPDTARAAAVRMVGEAIGTRGMIGGQTMDLEVERQWPQDAAGALERIHRGKTGALVKAALRLGGLVAGADAGVDARLDELGERVGLMFQIGDDILDVEGSRAALGKTPGKDAAARKLTYPGLFGLEESRRRLQRLRDESLALARELGDEGGLLASLVHYLASRDR
ncbi:MAG TPA: farnesyl diphosphate synthase [Thermoanaerobaculia bacterium]|nr:farnesyl diphosphate synthase [Thermoanaerobaculia bacterium]